MTPTQRLQAKWPQWEIEVFRISFISDMRQDWKWFAVPKGTRGPFFDVCGRNYNADENTYTTERGACQSCDRALTAIRRAVL